ncbi:hypothetical protein COR50_03210 [Chitinophaga caeni]|uniref:ABM domain-containing protein n=1 Tax=Chitinophaga caeni TaxID=2029983 RepID=A0A291QQI4_9BACT|nr:ester cyclase [Chitinophaga caeni]ATL46258.1 hypothetical protein COR50_03210 [Chitinophaga caeni]
MKHLMILLLMQLQVMGLGAQTQANYSPSEKTTNNMENKEIIRELYEEILNKRAFDKLDQIISPGYAGIDQQKGAKAFKKPILPLIAAFPGLKWELDHIVAEGDQVVACWHVTGTQEGPLPGIAATGKTVNSFGMAIYKLEAGQIVASEVHTDRLDFLQQLGVLPADVNAIPKPATTGSVYFIDQFKVPNEALPAFEQRMALNREMIKKMEGFEGDTIYKFSSGDTTQLITVAHWRDAAALEQAKNKVIASYQAEGFDMPAQLKAWGIQMERGIYKAVLK